MKEEVMIKITENGRVVGISHFSEDLEGVTEVVSEKVRRGSFIYPKNIFLRMLFRLLKCFGNRSKIVDWARRWKCDWIVYVPGVGVLGVYRDREEAIRREVSFLLS